VILDRYFAHAWTKGCLEVFDYGSAPLGQPVIFLAAGAESGAQAFERAQQNATNDRIYDACARNARETVVPNSAHESGFTRHEPTAQGRTEMDRFDSSERQSMLRGSEEPTSPKVSNYKPKPNALLLISSF
jgi:hypothetical protein